ncbi:hypothetical protein B0H11DRAFT_2192520 [Mycena galericulata]|nr:hypothetical protein B0H11DRAFT_2192520 [Mycena galericulata]
MTSIITSQPRLQSFAAESHLAYTSRRWKDKVKAIRAEMEQTPETDRYDDFDNWWDRLSDIVGILEAGAKLSSVCARSSASIGQRLRRQYLPGHGSLHGSHVVVRRETADALLYASQLDRWLSPHLTDIMEPLPLTENTNHDDPNLCSGEGLRPARAPSLQNLNIRDSSLQGVLVHQLMFAVRYPNFEQLRVKHDLQNTASDFVAILRDVRPRRGGRVMLCDAVELLQHRSSLLFSASRANEWSSRRNLYEIIPGV